MKSQLAPKVFMAFKLASLFLVRGVHSQSSVPPSPYVFTHPAAIVTVNGNEGMPVAVPIDVELQFTAVGPACYGDIWVLWLNGAVLYEEPANRTDTGARGRATVRTSIGAGQLFIDGGDVEHSLALSCGRRGSCVAEHRFRLSPTYAPDLLMELSAPVTAEIDVAALGNGLSVSIDARAFIWDSVGGGYVTLNGYEIGTIDSASASLLIPAWALREGMIYSLKATLLNHDNEPMASRTVCTAHAYTHERVHALSCTDRRTDTSTHQRGRNMRTPTQGRPHRTQ
jgi:hypothetical protein